MSEMITTALGMLDTSDDGLWTQDGAPRLDVLESLMGAKVSRAEVTAAAPGFSRENPTVASPGPNDSAPETGGSGAGASDDEISVDHAVAASKELESASLELAAAQRRHAAAVSESNAVFNAQNRTVTDADRAANTKRYLQSQCEQAVKTNSLNERIAALLKEAV